MSAEANLFSLNLNPHRDKNVSMVKNNYFKLRSFKFKLNESRLVGLWVGKQRRETFLDQQFRRCRKLIKLNDFFPLLFSCRSLSCLMN